MDKDALKEIKRITAGFKGKVKHKDMSANLTTLEEIRESFCSTCQQFFLDGKYIDRLPKIKIDRSDIQKEFSTNPITTDRLQNENILLNPEIWHYLVETKKERLLKDFQIVSDEKNNVFYFSELLTVESKALILRISKFNDGAYEKDAEKSSRHLEKLIVQNDLYSLSVLADFSEDFPDFSIHEYFLPYGLSRLESAVLLYRYDTSAKEHMNYYNQKKLPKREFDLYNQQFIPTVYKEVYPAKLAEPHFHFCEGVSSIYKLSSNPKHSKCGDGFGIGVKELCNYLIKIGFDKYKNSDEEELYQNNDFGMPFKHLSGNQFLKVLESVVDLENEPHDFLKAYGVFDSIDKINNRDMFINRDIDDRDKGNDK